MLLFLLFCYIWSFLLLNLHTNTHTQNTLIFFTVRSCWWWNERTNKVYKMFVMFAWMFLTHKHIHVTENPMVLTRTGFFCCCFCCHSSPKTKWRHNSWYKLSRWNKTTEEHHIYRSGGGGLGTGGWKINKQKIVVQENVMSRKIVFFVCFFFIVVDFFFLLRVCW